MKIRHHENKRKKQNRQRRNGWHRKHLSFLLTAAVAVSGLTLTPLVKPKKAEAATTLQNPRTDADGVSTWDCVYFGNYWQNDTNGDGKAAQNDQKEPIKWRVLSVDGDDAFLLADKSLDCKPYNTKYTSVTWETCTLRSWLNGYGSSSNAYGTDYSSDNFIDAAFSQAEQSAIRSITVVNDDNPYFGTEGGNNTTDKVYLLSIAEASTSSYGFNSKYRTNSNTRIAVNTAYAKGQGSSSGFGGWWLRSPGYYSYDAANVSSGGCGSSDGYYVRHDDFMVRPALHLNPASYNLYTYAGTVSSDEGSTEGSSPTPQGTPAEGKTVTIKKLKYKITRLNEDGTGEVALTGTTRKKSDKKFTSLNIGNTVTIQKKSFKITAIGTGAFNGFKELQSVTIGGNIQTVGKNAFYKCKKLKQLTIKSKRLKTVANNAITGIYKKTVIKVPKNKLKMYKKLFKSKTGYKKSMRITFSP